MKVRRKFNKQFKIDDVRFLESSEKTATEVASELGIPGDALSRWNREIKEENLKTFPGWGNPISCQRGITCSAYAEDFPGKTSFFKNCIIL